MTIYQLDELKRKAAEYDRLVAEGKIGACEGDPAMQSRATELPRSEGAQAQKVLGG